MSFLLSNLVEEIIANPEELDANTKACHQH